MNNYCSHYFLKYFKMQIGESMYDILSRVRSFFPFSPLYAKQMSVQQSLFQIHSKSRLQGFTFL